MALTQNIQYGDLLTVRNQGKKVACAVLSTAVCVTLLIYLLYNQSKSKASFPPPISRCRPLHQEKRSLSKK